MQDKACQGKQSKAAPSLNLAPSLKGPEVLAQLAQAGQGHAVLHFKDLRTLQLPFPDVQSMERCASG